MRRCPQAPVISFRDFARVLRERGRVASLAGQKRTAFEFYRRAERCERVALRADGAPWIDWRVAGHTLD